MRKILPFLLVSLLGFTAGCSTIPKTDTAAPLKAAQIDLPTETTPWLYKGSDIPPEPSWTFGELPNGVRYAVKHNDVPAGQMSMRIRIDAGSLHENEDELGFAHLIEHLSMRGSVHVPDGESKRIWQRFGVSFGSDSNAQTTPTQTVYKLDLPNISDASLDESVKILSGMIRDPNISESALKAERAIVQAELREGSGPAATYGDALRETFFKGQRLEKRSTIGSLASLDSATAAGVEAFHARWYRPENTVVVMAGDAQPAELARLVAKYFGDWKPAGTPTPAPDFGKPMPGEVTKLVQDPVLPPSVTIGYVRPWEQVNDTVVYNEGLMIDALAIQIINRRLGEQARAGGNYLVAEASQDDFMRSGDLTNIYITPVEGRWEEATRDVRAVIADALASPPSVADINREYALLLNALKTRVENAPFEAASIQADSIVQAVDIRETIAAPDFALKVVENLKPKLDPARVYEATKRQFSADAARLLLSSPTAVKDADKRMVAALTGSVDANTNVRLAENSVGFEALPALGAPGKIVDSRSNPDLGITKLELSNGVRAVLYPNKREADQIRMVVRFGKGLQAVAPGGTDFLWAGPLVLNESGVGNLKQMQIEQMTLGRRIGLTFGIDDDAFEFNATTRPADLADQLKLIAAKMENPGWDPAPVARARELARTGYDSYEMSAMAVLERDLTWLLASKDKRFQQPGPADIAKLNAADFRKFWEPILQDGPVEVLIFGDFDVNTVKTTLETTLGAIRPRTATPVKPAALVRKFPEPNKEPLRLTHRGPADQTAAVLAWPTGGGIDKIGEGRELEILAAVFRDRLFEKFRGEQAASYSPDMAGDWPEEFPSGGYVFAYSQVQPEQVARFFTFAEEVAKDLVANPVSDDELKRAIEPTTQLIDRQMTGNTYWLLQLKGMSYQPEKMTAFSTLFEDYEHITPASLQALAKKYLVPGKAWKLVVEPAAKPADTPEATR